MFDKVRNLALAVLCSSVIFTGTARAESPLLIQVVQAELANDEQILSLIGEIVAREKVGLSFPMGGRILSISVRAGDQVTEGQELARLESVQQEQALLGVEAALEAAKADLFQAREEFDRQDRFLKRGATTRIRRDEADRRFRIAQANVDRAEAELRRAQKTYDDTFLYASSAGTVIDRLADPGEVVTGAHPVLELTQGGALDAVFDAPEALPAAGLEIDFATLGIDLADMEISLVLIDKPEVSFVGRVRKVSPLVDPLKGTVEVSIGVNQPPTEALYGDAVRGTFMVSGPRRIILPYSALTAVGDGPAVWIIDPVTLAVNLSPVTIARYTDSRFIIESGVEPGQRVATSATQLLYPGRIIRLKGDQ